MGLMPTVWRYLLRSYFQVFLLCIASFVAALFVMRFKEIAEFATLNSDGLSIFLFSIYQLPYILPVAIPVSCVIASILLFQKMSHSQELTALRAAGLSIKTLLYPLFLAGLFLSLLNFTIVAEIGPRCRFLAKELSYQMTSNNPFYIFNKITEGKMTNAYVEIRTLRGGKKAKDVLLILNNRQHQRLGIMTAKELSIQGSEMVGKDVSIISSVTGEGEDNYDHLVIENQESMSTQAASLSKMLHDAKWHLRPEYMCFKDLIVRLMVSRKAILSNMHSLELARRLSLALTPLAFTLLGAAFGMEIGRQRNKKGILWSVALTALYLIAFIGAKSMKHFPKTAWALYFLPFIVIAIFSIRSLKRVARGIE
jgi:lipopolysaccharide export system permease protein